MVDVFKMGANSLKSLQLALATTGHNIANVNTEGFSRQRVHFTTHEPERMGFGFVGRGARIQNVERSYNDFLTSQVQQFTSNQSRYDGFVQFSSRVDNIVANSETSLNTSLQNLFSAINDVSASPATLPERQNLVGEARNLVEKQRSFFNLLQDLNSEVNSSLRQEVAEINGIAESISQLNQQIVSASSSGNLTPPNDLLDQRDNLLRELSSKIDVTTTEEGNGALNIFIGRGQPLVIGSQITRLQVETNAYDSSRLEVGVEGTLANNGNSRFVTGGTLEGMLDFRTRMLYPALSQIGLVTLGLGEAMNSQQRSGMDLNGDLGADMFAPTTVPVFGRTINSGDAAPAVSIDNVSQIRPSEYQLNYDGTQWHLSRLSDDSSVSGAGPLSLDGMTVDVSAGTPASGDSFRFNPGRSSAATFDLVLTDPRKIAAAMPAAASSDASNAGLAQLDDLTVSPVNGLPLASPLVLTFNPDALGAGVPGFDVTGGPGGIPPLAYDPATESAGKTFSPSGLGISFTISDVPADGDSFSISNNGGATGDNRNALLMGQLQNQRLIDGGNSTFQELYGSMVAQVGVTQRQGVASLDVETSLLEQATAYRDAAVGVNLDEEAANLLRFQQAYQASAQMVTIADEMFQTLINSLR